VDINYRTSSLSFEQQPKPLIASGVIETSQYLKIFMTPYTYTGAFIPRTSKRTLFVNPTIKLLKTMTASLK
jgi:hypothetical protein